MESLFETKNVCCFDEITYPDITIYQGKTTFICGESGCGKTTLLRMLNGTVLPSSGTLLYQQKPLSFCEMIAHRRDVLLVTQDLFLFEGTIQDNFNEYYKYRGLPPLEDEKIREYLSLCQGEFPLDASCINMSGGERQRIFLGICLSLMPKVLLLDEPTSALDTVTAHRLMDSLTKYSKEQEMTLIIVSHDASLAEKYGQARIELKKGGERL